MASNKGKRTVKSNSSTKAGSRTQKGSGRRYAEPEPRTGLSPRVRSILYAAAAAFFAIMILFRGASIWTNIRAAFIGVFGLGIVLVPAVFVYLCVMNEKEKRAIAHFKAKVALCVLTVLFAGALVYILSGTPHKDEQFLASLGNLWLDAYRAVSTEGQSYLVFSCGFIGGIFGWPLANWCGTSVAAILSLLALAAIIFILANLSVNDVARAVRKARAEASRQLQKRRERRQLRQQETEPVPVPQMPQIDIPYTDTDARRIDIPLDDPAAKKKTKKKKPVREGLDRDVSDTGEGNAKEKDLSVDLQNIISRASRPELGRTSTLEHIAEDITQEKRSNRMRGGAKQPDPETVPFTVKKAKKKGKPKPEDYDEFENLGYGWNDWEEDKSEPAYHYPPVQLLNLPQNTNEQNAMEELQTNSRKLIDTLNSFGVNATITNICRGPSVTRYELQPAPGVKISKITNLSDDIALNLAANGVRIEAPIPGKAAVGIEVPNKVVSMVSMRELIDSDKFRRAKSKLTAVLGRDISGEIVLTDIAKMPHLLIAGTTGSGKSVCVNSILISILYKATPDEVKLLLIDPKMVEFSKYKGIPHLLVPIVSDAKKAAAALGWAVNEMLNRYKIFSEFDCKDIDSYNALIERNLRYIEEHPPVENEEGETVQPVIEINGLPVAKEKMSRVVIAIDELADLMMAAPSEVEDSICRLAQMARAAGMHLILATQRPTVNVITGLIKANVPSRISLKVSSNMDSRTILDVGGGEKLIGRGDMLFSPVGAPKPIRVQGCYASEEEIEGVTAYIKKSARAEYNAEIEENIKRIEAEGIGNGKKGADTGDTDDIRLDSKMEEAIQFVIESGQASTSMLQRRLKVGYARAGRMIDDMEQLGIVGPHQGSKPRDVLMTYNEWLERRNVLQNNG